MLDGADVSLCVIDKKQGTMRYAGAKGLMFLHQANQLHTLETDRRSIGETGIRSFVTRTCAVQPGDLLVLTSDGFADQFGGEENKKFGKPRLRKLITELSAYPNDILPARLGYVLSAWQGQQEQTDDICMLMYRI
jgi:serine phosphatase RsbU (regulator of sigma subunit)